MREADLDFGWDFAVPNALFSFLSLEAFGIKQIKLPGGDLSEDSPFQFVEDE